MINENESIEVVVEGFSGRQVVDNTKKLDSALSQKDINNSNAFWLHATNKTFPCIQLLINGDFAVLHYFVKEKDAGYRSITNISNNLDPDGNTIFYLSSNGEKLEVWNDMVITFDLALSAAQEFLQTGLRPSCLEWEDL